MKSENQYIDFAKLPEYQCAYDSLSFSGKLLSVHPQIFIYTWIVVIHVQIVLS